MPYGSLLADVVQSSVANTPPQFNDTNGVQTGTLCRAWVNYDGTTQLITGSFNVSSVTYVGTGQYTVNFTNAMSSATYATVLGFNNQASNVGANLKINGYTTTSVTVNKYENGSLTNCSTVSVSVFR